MPEQRPVFQLANELEEDWIWIRQAEDQTAVRLTELPVEAAAAASSAVAFVVFGSAARREITSGSDLDWTLLVDAPSDPAHFESKLEVGNALTDASIDGPGPEGTFGGLAFSHELLHRIGGEDDTNRNLTQRILLLLESAAVGNREAHDRVIRNVLSRYIAEDWGLTHASDRPRVPRFLQNDIARYWRTVAVDFAYKRRDRESKGWALRTVKLRLSRKMTYAAGLLACFSCELDDVLNGAASEAASAVAVEHLHRRLSLPPLDIIATTVLGIRELHDDARVLFGAYDQFLALLDDDEKRERLKNLPPGASGKDKVYQEAREIGHRFQAGLDGIFFDNYEPLFKLTQMYGVF